MVTMKIQKNYTSNIDVFSLDTIVVIENFILLFSFLSSLSHSFFCSIKNERWKWVLRMKSFFRYWDLESFFFATSIKLNQNRERREREREEKQDSRNQNQNDDDDDDDSLWIERVSPGRNQS